MRLRRLDLTRYGKFADARLDFGEKPAGPDLTVVYGLNEAGKSTAFAAFLDLLFRIEPRTPYGYLHGVDRMEIGAALEFEGATHEVRRVRRQTGSLLDAAGRPLAEALLGGPLAGLTRETYRAMFSLDETSLAQGGEAILESKGELGALLFSASSGLAELSRALETMRAEADELHRKNASTTRVAALRRRLDELRQKREALDTQAAAYRQLAAAQRAAAQSYESALAELAAAREAQAQRHGLLRAAPIARDHAQAQARLAALAALPRPPAGWSGEAPRLLEADARLTTRLAELERRAARLVEEIDAIRPDEPALATAPRIDALAALADRWSGAEKDLPRRRAALAERDGQLRDRLALLGRAGADPRSLILPAPAAARLRDLIEARSGVEADVRGAEDALAEAERGFAEAEAERARLGEEADAPQPAALAALRATAARLRAGDPAGALARAAREAESSRRALAEALARLAPWRGDAAALRATQTPDARRLEAWRADLAAIEARRAALAARLVELQTEEREAAAGIESARRSAGRIDDAAAQAAFAAREAAWARHLATLDRRSADTFEAAMRAVDALAEARLAQADDLAEWRERAAQSALRAVRLERQAELIDAAQRDLDALGATIAAETPPPLRAGAPGAAAAAIPALENWVRAREAALAAAEAAAAADAAQEALRAEAEREAAAARAALAPFAVHGAALDLPALLAAAEAAIGETESRRKAREEAGARARAAGRLLAERRARAEAARAAGARWRADWAAALAGLWLGERGDDPRSVRALLDAAAELPKEVEARESIARSVAAMDGDQQRFRAEIAALAVVLGDDVSALTPPEAAARFVARLEQARRAAQRRADLSEDQATLAREREALGDDLRIHAARKAEMLGFFGAADLAAAAGALRDCEERDRLAAEQERRAAQIVAETGAATLDDALARLAGLDADALRREAEADATRIELLDGRVRERFAEMTRTTDRLEAVGGDDAAARLEAERRTVLLDIADIAQRHLRLRVGELMAADALRLYRDRRRSSMMERASQAFSLITRGDYPRLSTQTEKERETLIAITRAGAARGAPQMSTGARAQLYLALRLAGYEEFAALRPTVPFIADDIMETFDEPRAEQAFRLLARMGEAGQVIYLTHHCHLCDIARAVAPSARLVELAP